MGSYCSVINNTQHDLHIHYGPNVLALKIITIIVALWVVAAAIVFAPGELISVIKDTAEAAQAMWKFLESLEGDCQQKNLRKIAPGGRYTSEKLSLSLIIQANVVVKKVNYSNNTVDMYSGAFRCWSGPTADSTSTFYLNDELRYLDHQVTTVRPANSKSSRNALASFGQLALGDIPRSIEESDKAKAAVTA